MNNRDNLRQAAKDFFGVEANKLDKEGETAQNPELYTGMSSAIPAVKHRSEPAAMEGAESHPGMSEVVVLEPRKQTSVIAEGTSITGRIRSSGHIEIMGKVDGNIDADGDVTICGKVSGNIKGDQLRLLSCQIKGNMEAESRVMINSESTIIGDINSDSLVMDGKLKGNVNVNKAAIFNCNSYLLGDIVTSTISIDAGAIINGMVKTFIDYDADSPFDKM